jgi:hypothetical protein
LGKGRGFDTRIRPGNKKIWNNFKASNTMKSMARSVTISTPVPTLEEFGKSLGLSKTRRESLLRLVYRDSVSGQFVTKKRGTTGVLRERVSPKR